MSNLSTSHDHLFDELDLGIVVIDKEQRRTRFANAPGRRALQLDGDRLPPELERLDRLGGCVSFVTPCGDRVFARVKRLRSGDVMLTIAKPRGEDHVMTLLRTSCQLSERETQVAELITRGLSNKKIAAQLGLAVSTVKAHVTSVLAAVAVASRAELIVALEQFR